MTHRLVEHITRELDELAALEDDPGRAGSRQRQAIARASVRLDALVEAASLALADDDLRELGALLLSRGELDHETTAGGHLTRLLTECRHRCQEGKHCGGCGCPGCGYTPAT